MKRIATLICFGSASLISNLISTNVYAANITYNNDDVVNFGGKSWLKLEVTQGLSYNEVENAFNNSLSGWRFATEIEVKKAFAIDSNTSDFELIAEVVGTIKDPSNPEVDFFSDGVWKDGVFDDSNPLGRLVQGLISAENQVCDFCSNTTEWTPYLNKYENQVYKEGLYGFGKVWVGDGKNTKGGKNAKSSLVGSFLVKEVPEPITGLVFAAGLGGAALKRAKDKSKSKKS